MAKESKAFGSQRAYKQHLTLGKGGVAGEVADLRGDVEEGFQNMEAREGFPEVYYIDGAGPSAAGADMILKGVNLLQGQTFDELVLWAGTSMVTITCLKPGNSPFTIQVTDGATAGAEVVTKTGDAFVVQIQVGVSTADQIATAINADGADSDGHLRAASGGSGTTNAIAAATAMSGGEGDFDGNKVTVGGVECLPANTPGTAGAAAWSDDTITVTVPALAPIVATDQAALKVMSDGTSADTLGVTVQA
jgi:hypothetical protein